MFSLPPRTMGDFSTVETLSYLPFSISNNINSWSNYKMNNAMNKREMQGECNLITRYKGTVVRKSAHLKEPWYNEEVK